MIGGVVAGSPSLPDLSPAGPSRAPTCYSGVNSGIAYVGIPAESNVFLGSNVMLAGY